MMKSLVAAAVFALVLQLPVLDGARAECGGHDAKAPTTAEVTQPADASNQTAQTPAAPAAPASATTQTAQTDAATTTPAKPN